MKTLYFHIGSPKTGTTSIQNFCTDHREILEGKGLCYPIMPFVYEHKSKRRNGLFLTSKYVKDGVRDQEQEKENFHRGLSIIEQKFDTVDTVLLSDEGAYSMFFRRKLYKTNGKMLAQWAKDHQIQLKIIIYLRSQADYVMSWYNQLIKHSVSETLSSLTWEEYLKNYKRYVALDYYKYLNILSDIFGKENIIVKRFDRAFFKNGSLVDDFMNIFGIEIDDAFPADSSKSEQNHGITENACAIKRVINTIDGIQHEEKQRFEQVLRSCSSSSREASRYSLMSDEEAEKFMERYQMDNQKIVDEYIKDGLPLFQKRKHKEKWTQFNTDYMDEMVRFLCLSNMEANRRIDQLERMLKQQETKRTVDRIKNMFGKYSAK